MGLSYPTSLVNWATPLSTLDLGQRGNATVEMLQEHGFTPYVGLTFKALKQIQAASREKDIAENCPNDQKRYSDTGVIAWMKKNRISPFIYTPKDDLGAYGGIGPGKNDIIPTAGITTAYRATQAGITTAREIRQSREPNFRIGRAITELVVAIGITQLDLQPTDISLETWKSNYDARRMYDDVGFVQKAELLEEKGRPTLHNLGEFVDGNPVFVDPDDANARLVIDSRCYYVLENY